MNRLVAPIEAVHVVGGTGQPSLQNNWGSLAGFGPFGFWKDSNTGLVHFQGIIQNSGDPAANSVVFTLPVGYRPALPRLMDCVTNTLSTTFVQVNANGDVLVVANLGASAAVYFDGKCFRP